MRTEQGSSSTLNSDWVSDNEVADPAILPQMLGWKVLVRPLSPRKKTKGGIILVEKTKDDIAYLTTVGRVLAVGPLAFQRDDMLVNVTDGEGHLIDKVYRPWFKVGDYITYGKYAGAKRLYKGVKMLILNDDEAIDIIDDPSSIDTMYNLSSGAES